MVKLNVGVDDDLHEALRHLSVRLKLPLTQLVPRLLREAVKREEARLAAPPPSPTPEAGKRGGFVYGQTGVSGAMPLNEGE